MSLNVERVYLDHNAQAPLLPEAAAAMHAVMALTGNPSSVHWHGRMLRRLVESAREQVAALVGAEPGAVIFTSGGTEANALALTATGRRRILVSAVEHSSILQAATQAATNVQIIPVDNHGIVRLDRLQAMLASDNEPALVSVMLANNETGVLQPFAEVAAIAHAHCALAHCDAVQAIGKIPVDVGALGADLLTVSAHKLGGPAGVGALVVDRRAPITASLRGGGQERGRRAGTENAIGIVGFGAAAEVGLRADVSGRLVRLRDRLERRLRACCPGMTVVGASVPRLPNTSCVAMPGVETQIQVIAFDLAGISVGTGAACSSGKSATSHVLTAMGFGEDIASSVIRVSTGCTTSDLDMNRFFEAWSTLYARSSGVQGRSAALFGPRAVGQIDVGKVTE